MSIELDFHIDVPKLGCAPSIRVGNRGSELRLFVDEFRKIRGS